MEAATIELFQATDATDAYGIKLPGDAASHWKAQRGFGQDYKPIWTVEAQSNEKPDWDKVDWDAVLDRVVEASTLSDPVLANFDWPVLSASK